MGRLPDRIGAIACALLLAGSCGDPAPGGPNVLLITIDTLRADHLGCYGYGRDTSPAIDALAAGGMRFDRAQASSSWTLPGLASVHTALYSSTHGCWTFASALDPSFVTLAETLRDAGYDTAGVASHVFLATDYGLHQGFVHYDEELVNASGDESHEQISSPAVSDKGVRFLEHKAGAADGSPWMLWLHYFDPHTIYQTHEGISERFGTEEPMDLYDGEIAFTDLHVGRVLDRLGELGLADDTVVVLLSDHGEEFGDHGGRAHGHTLYRELVRVPFLMRGPGIESGACDAVVRTVDLAPTLLELCGVAARRPMHGRSLVPMLAGLSGAGEPEDRPAIAELRLNDDNRFDAIVADGWKLVVDVETGEVQLFDLRADPAEQHDVAADHEDVVGRLRTRLGDTITDARRDGEAYTLTGPRELLPEEMRSLEHLGYAGDH